MIETPRGCCGQMWTSKREPQGDFLKNKMWAVSHGSFLTQCLWKEKCDPSPCQKSSILSSRNSIIGSISENTVSQLRFPRVQRQNLQAAPTEIKPFCANLFPRGQTAAAWGAVCAMEEGKVQLWKCSNNWVKQAEDLILLCFVSFPWSANKPENKLLICLIPQPGREGMVETGGLCFCFTEAIEKEMCKTKGRWLGGQGEEKWGKAFGIRDSILGSKKLHWRAWFLQDLSVLCWAVLRPHPRCFPWSSLSVPACGAQDL